MKSVRAEASIPTVVASRQILIVRALCPLSLVFFLPLPPWLSPSPFDPPPEKQAYVKQEDVFYSQLTVRETLLMAARLRLPRSMPLDEKIDKVDELISKLGLSKVRGGVGSTLNVSMPVASSLRFFFLARYRYHLPVWLLLIQLPIRLVLSVYALLPSLYP